MEHKSVLENKLREFRFNRDRITQEELANALGISRQTICKRQGLFLGPR